MTLQQLAQNAIIEWRTRHFHKEITLMQMREGINRILEAQSGGLK